jgi:arylsulfatase A-like enzyme
MRILSFVLGLVLLTAASIAAEKPNVVLIFADDLGINELSCYGRKDQPTPNLDRMAAEGMRFTCGYCAQPICSPSRAGIMTGKTPGRLHLTTFLPGRADAKSQMVLHPKIRMELPLEEKTLAEHLKEAGYVSACIGKWHLGGAGFGPQEQGFDVAFASRPNTEPSATEGGKGEYEHTGQALKFIEENKEKPFFLYVPYNTPHIPLAAKSELIAKHKDAFYPTYAAMIASVDESVGRISALLDELKLADNTVLIFSSDNGGVGGYVREGIKQAGDITDNTPLRSGKGSLYEGGTRDPFIVRWPGKVKPGSTCDVPSIHVDVYPTLLELAGAKRPEGYILDGESLVPLLHDGNANLKRDAIYQHFPGYLGAGPGFFRTTPVSLIEVGDWKLMEFFEDGRLELYNLKDDIGEKNNLATAMPDKTRELHNRLLAWRKEINAPLPTPNKPSAASSDAPKAKGKRKAKAKAGCL